MLKVITIGSAVKDVFLTPSDYIKLHNDKFTDGVGLCLERGGKYEASDIFYDTGGGATNAAATLSNLGIKCGVVTNVGNDLTGEEIYNELKNRKVNLDNFIIHKSLGTGYSTVLMHKSGERSIIVYRGASAQFNPQDLQSSKMKAEWFYLTNVKGNIKFLDKVFIIAKKNKTKIFWNPGKSEIKKGIKVLKKYLMFTDILSVNREEAEILTKNSSLRDNLNNLNTICDIVLITDGKKGAYLATKGVHYFIPSTGTPPLNTTGAGDAFGSGFLAGLIKFGNWENAVKIGVWNSDGVISQMGAKHGLIEKWPSKFKMNKIKIKKMK